MSVHPTALVHPSVDLPADAEIGPFAVIDEDVEVGPEARVGPRCHLYPGTRLGPGVELWDGVVVGAPPQDFKFRGEKTGVHIGAGTRLREYVTVHRGTRASGLTRIGRNCMIMAYSHVAHDCRIGDGVVVANAVQMGGHVSLGDQTVVSGMTGISQFVTIGRGSFVGGGLRVDRDVPPYSKALGEPLRWAGVNRKGLVKDGLDPAEVVILKRFYRGLRDSTKAEFMARIQAGAPPEGIPLPGPGVTAEILAFFRDRRRGLLI